MKQNNAQRDWGEKYINMNTRGGAKKDRGGKYINMNTWGAKAQSKLLIKKNITEQEQPSKISKTRAQKHQAKPLRTNKLD